MLLLLEALSDGEEHLVLPPGAIERQESSPLTKVIDTDTHPNHQLVAGRSKFEVVRGCSRRCWRDWLACRFNHHPLIRRG